VTSSFDFFSLAFRTHFHIHREAAGDDRVKITVFPVNPVIYKVFRGISLHGAVMKKEIPVEPTTVEEYRMLRHIGLILGEDDMPEVVFPV